MDASVRSWRRCAAFPALVAVMALPGCLTFTHPIHAPPREEIQDPLLLPRCCRDHVHIFFVTGLDPLNCANLTGLAGYCHRIGFCNTYHGQLFHGHALSEKIRSIRAEDPESQFVLIGFSYGANLVRLMAHNLDEKNGIDVALLFYMGGNQIEDEPYSYPPSVGKVIHILATGYIWKGEQLERAENYKYSDCWHFGSPTHPVTLRTLAHELARVAGEIPFEMGEHTLHDGVSQSLRPTHGELPAEAPEWGFLKPAVALPPIDD